MFKTLIYPVLKYIFFRNSFFLLLKILLRILFIKDKIKNLAELEKGLISFTRPINCILFLSYFDHE